MEFELEELKDEIDMLKKEISKLSKYNLINLKINHKKFGIGKIIEQIDFIVTIEFENEKKKLKFPYIFSNNIVECEDKNVLDKMNKMTELENRIIDIEKEIKTKEYELTLIKNSFDYVDKNPNLFAVSVGISFDEVIRTKMYYCKAYKCKRICDYLGLYKNKSIIKIGKIKKIIEAYMLDDNLVTDLVSGESIKEEDINLIKASIEKGIELFNCNIGDQNHKYFIIDEFYDTDYKKNSFGALQQNKYFDLNERLKNNIPTTIQELANKLRDIEW